MSRFPSRSPLPLSPRRPSAEPDSPDLVLWLDCRGRYPSSLYEEVHAALEASFGRRGVLLVVPLHLEHVLGPLSDFVVGLESLLQTSPVPVVLADPTGYATLVLRTLERESDVRVYRPTGASARPRRILIVDASGAHPVADVLEAFGHSTMLARSGAQAQGAIKTSDYDVVVLDLDLPRAQLFGVAAVLKTRRRITLLGVTSSDASWAREHLERSGLTRILSKPLSVMEVLEELA
jgi:CheY-like chemotaxis protein